MTDPCRSRSAPSCNFSAVGRIRRITCREGLDHTASIFPDALDRALTNIRATTKGDYEVVVVSPFKVVAADVLWIEETERNGCAFAHTVGAKHATGDFITATADDCDYVPAWDQRMIQIYGEEGTEGRQEFLSGTSLRPARQRVRNLLCKLSLYAPGSGSYARLF